MPTTKLYVGSSSAAKPQAQAFVAKFTSPALQFLPWWEAYTAGRARLEDLNSIRGQVDGAVLLFSPEAESTVRGNIVQTPNLNVLFEFGYFCGYLGKQKTVMLKYGDFYMPSDFGGHINIFGSKFFNRGSVIQVGRRTESEFSRWFISL